MKPLSIQLYTVREQMKDGNHLAVLERLAQIGYKGVEGYGYGMTPTAFRTVVENLGMSVSSYFGPWPEPDTVNEFVDTALGLGVRHTVSGLWIPDFDSVEAIERTADRIRAVRQTILDAGLTFSLHNHWFEFQPVEGRLAIDRLLELLPDQTLEIDVYWACAFGANDPAEQVAKHRSRAPLLHVKDGPNVQGQPHTAVGSGTLDIPRVLGAADPEVTDWLIVELDECATDMMEAVAQSYRYLVGNGLAEGNRAV